MSTFGITVQSQDKQVRAKKMSYNIVTSLQVLLVRFHVYTVPGIKNKTF